MFSYKTLPATCGFAVFPFVGPSNYISNHRDGLPSRCRNFSIGLLDLEKFAEEKRKDGVFNGELAMQLQRKSSLPMIYLLFHVHTLGSKMTTDVFYTVIREENLLHFFTELPLSVMVRRTALTFLPPSTLIAYRTVLSKDPLISPRKVPQLWE